PSSRGGAGQGWRWSRSGLDVLQVLEESWVLWLPAECLPGAGARGGLVGREDRSEHAEALLRHRLDGEPQPLADNGGDVTHGVALVTHGVPRGPGRRLLEGQPEEDGRVKRVHGGPALGAVA